MLSIRCVFIYSIVIIVHLKTSESRFPTNLQNLELDDITSLWEKLPSIATKIKEAINRLRCPKGWKRIGGSCYLLPDVTSQATLANATCNLVHSNRSNLMQIRHTVELLYAAHVLTKYNLSALLIELDPQWIEGKSITKMLMNNEDRWRELKEKYYEIRKKYLSIKEKVIDELDAAGLKISRRSKKTRRIFYEQREKLADGQINLSDLYEDYRASSDFNETANDEFEYDDLDESDDADEFEKFDTVSNICDQIDWNVLNNDTSVYVLTAYLVADKIVCSLSNVEPEVEYNHICEYVLDFCFANVVCGKNGRCVNTLAGFKCSCGFLYGGLVCERVSKQGYQIIIGAFLVIFLYSLSFKPIRTALVWLVKFFKYAIGTCFCFIIGKKKAKKDATETKKDVKEKEENDDDHYPTLAEEIQYLVSPKIINSTDKPDKRDLIRLFWVGGLSIIILSILFTVPTLTNFSLFEYEITDETRFDVLINETARLVSRCKGIADYRNGNMVFFPFAVALIILFSWSVKRETKCPDMCDGRPGVIPPIEPFRTANRFTSAAVFGILAFEVLKIFEEMIFSRSSSFSGGIFFEILERLVVIILSGLRYYPVLASLQLQNVMARFFAACYILGDIVYAVIREGYCMGFLPLSRYYSTLEEAKLRMELGTWFIIYGLVKNTPHFIFLSYIGAEFCVRFAYDSVYVPLKKGVTICSAPVCPVEEYRFAKYYVAKLFRRNLAKRSKSQVKSSESDELSDFQHELMMRPRPKKTRINALITYFYRWDDDFRFTNLATCTYTVAIVFLYYLACTFVFIYIARTSGHISFIRNYIESTFHIEVKGYFSLRTQIITSAILAMLIYVRQLFVGIKSYKKHKKQIFQGIYHDIPSADNFNANSITSKAVHYSGFLVGYMAWGFIISFHLILILLSAINILSLQMQYLEWILAFTVPVMLIYLINILGNSTLTKFAFIRDFDEKLNIENRKAYAIFLYFNFFADCFLGIASCIIRLIKAMFLNIFFMARLDCSFLGRPIERFDLGFAAYVSYLHMEATHTNPIMLAFCYSLYEEAVNRREKAFYVDECCIAPGELDDDDSTRDHTKAAQSKIQQEPDRIPLVVKPSSVTCDETRSRTQTKKRPSNTSTDLQRRASKYDDENDEDGGPQPPSINTIKTVIPKGQPRLPAPSVPGPDIPKRRDIQDDEDEDGGLKRASTSTITKIMPHKIPVLPPPIPPRRDLITPKDNKDNDDNYDEDGGLKVKPVVKKANNGKKKNQKPKIDEDDDDGGLSVKSVEKKKKKEDKKKKPNKAFLLDDDEDGGVRPKPRIKSETKKKSIKPVQDDDDDDDGVMPMKTSKAKSNQPQPIKMVTIQKQIGNTGDRVPSPNPVKSVKKSGATKVKTSINDDDDDDDGVSRRKPSTHSSKPIKKESSPKTEVDDLDDDDGGRRVKTYDTVIKIMPKKAPVLDHSSAPKQPLPETPDDGSFAKSFKSTEPPASHDTVAKLVSDAPDFLLKMSTKQSAENHYDRIPTDEERIARAYANYEPPPYGQASTNQEILLMRTISYREAQQNTPPLIQRRPTISSSNRSQSNSHEEGSLYSEIVHSSDQNTGVINRSYSHTGSLESASNHSLKQQRRETTEEPLDEDETEEEDDEEEDEEEEEDEDEDDEEQEEEDQDQCEEKKPSQSAIPRRIGGSSKVSTAYATISHLVDPIKAEEMNKIRRARSARFRWFLAYTILNNYHLFDLRKQVQSRLARLRINRGSTIEIQTVATSEEEIAPARISPVPSAKILVSPPSPIAKPTTPHHLTVPLPLVDQYPQSPAERYIAICSCLLYDANGQPTNQNSSAPGSVITQNQHEQRLVAPEFSSKMGKQRPFYERQASEPGTKQTLGVNIDETPKFQPVPESNPSLNDYPMVSTSTVTNSSIIRTQMNHAQHMHVWEQNKLKKLQKKQRNCYVYGALPKRSMEGKFAKSAIITPQPLVPQRPPESGGGTGVRSPSKSPFYYVASRQMADATLVQENEKSDPKLARKNLRTTAALKHDKEHSGYSSNVTEV